MLTKIRTLREDQPWPAYDSMTIEEIRTRLTDAGTDVILTVRDYERRHQNRADVLSAILPTD